jgi:hypothetical protein
LRRLAALVALLLLCSACQITVQVGIDVDPDGSGQVRVGIGLDRDAAKSVGDLAAALRVDDLERSGWTVTDPQPPDRDGIVWVRASKPFSTPEQVAGVVAEVSGEDGPFRDFEIERNAALFSSTVRFRGTVDLGGGLEAFGDDDLRARLGGTSVGATEDELTARLRQPLNRAFKFRVDVRLPGDVESNAPLEASGGASWQPTLGETVTLQATARRTETTRVVAAAVAAIALLALVGLLVIRRLSSKSRE